MSESAAAFPSAERAAERTYVIQGRAVTLPVVVRDAAAMTAMFLVDAEQVRALVPRHPELHVPELFPGRAIAVISCIEYRDNDLGQYNEVSVAFFVTRGTQAPSMLFGVLLGLKRGDLGAYIHRLPVTTTFSRDAGRDIWGFPKTVEDIRQRDEGTQRACDLFVDGAHVLTLSMPRGGRRRMKDTPQDAYAWRDGVLYRTPSIMGGEGVGMHLGGAVLTLGRHPIADELRALGLPKRPLMSNWTEHMHATFEAPEKLSGRVLSEWATKH